MKLPKIQKVWTFDQGTAQVRPFLARIKKVALNTYVYEGNRLITTPVFFTRKAALIDIIAKLDYQIEKLRETEEKLSEWRETLHKQIKVKDKGTKRKS